MGFKRQDRSRQISATRGNDEALQQGRMAAMNSVKITNCQHRWTGNRTRIAAKNLHLMPEKKCQL